MPRNFKTFYEPGNEELRSRLHDMSESLFGCLGLGGVLAPTRKQWRQYKPRDWPSAVVLLRWYGLPQNAGGWATFVSHYNMQLPDRSLLSQAAYRRKRSKAQQARAICTRDDGGLEGEWEKVRYYHWTRRCWVYQWVYKLK